MAVVRKTVSIPEELYRQVTSEGRGFSEIVREAIEEYIRKKRKEKAISLFGSLKDWEIKNGAEFVDEVRQQQLERQEQREKWLDI